MNSPYREQPVGQVESGMDLFGKWHVIPTKKGQSERGILLEYFAKKLGRSVGYVAMRCKGLELPDLYYMKSAADRYEREGKGPWGKAWFGMLKPKAD